MSPTSCVSVSLLETVCSLMFLAMWRSFDLVLICFWMLLLVLVWIDALAMWRSFDLVLICFGMLLPVLVWIDALAMWRSFDLVLLCFCMLLPVLVWIDALAMWRLGFDMFLNVATCFGLD